MNKDTKITILTSITAAVLLTPLALNALGITGQVSTESPEVFIIDIKNAVNDWRTLGLIAGAISFLQIAMKVLKLQKINDWFVEKKIKWVKPYIAIAISALIGGLTSYSSGTDVINSIFAGIILGMASVGWNEVINKANASKRIK